MRVAERPVPMFVVVILAILAASGARHLLSEQAPQVGAAPSPQLKEVIIGNDKIGRYGWSRENAVEFALGQLAKLIDYVFVATLAMLGIIVKTCVLDRMNVKKDDKPPALTYWERGLISGIIISLAGSAILGLFAYGYLPMLLTAESFSLNDEVGVLVFCQYVTCAVGVVLIGGLCGYRLWFSV